MCQCFYVFMCRIVAVSLSSLDLFICWHLCLCPPHPTQLSFYTVCPHDSQCGDSVPYQLVVFCLRPSSLTAVYPVPSPDTLYDFLSLPLAVLYPTTPPPTEPAVVSNQNNIFKNSVNITPTNSEGLLVGYSCIQVYIVSWWRCTRNAGEPNMAIPSKFDEFIHGH